MYKFLWGLGPRAKVIARAQAVGGELTTKFLNPRPKTV